VIEAPRTGSSTVTVSDYLSLWLKEREVAQVFTLPGGMIAPLLDAIYRQGDVELVTMHHEQAVAFAVDGYGRYHGTPGVGLSTAGPGATNMLTAIASSYLDSVPGVYVAGQVQAYLQKGDRAVRQYGFQECDTVAMAAPVTKAAWRARSAAEVPALLDEAWALAVSGRPGPVFVELPSDVQTMPIGEGAASDLTRYEPPRFEDAPAVDELLDALARAERPLLLIGGGVHAARAAERFRAFARCLGVPVAASVVALDVLPAGDPLRLGMIGMYGNRWVNHAACEADVVAVFGSRLDFGTVGADVVAWGRGRTVFQVDCDPGEMQRVRRAHRIEADLGAFLDLALSRAQARSFEERPEWLAHLDDLRYRWPDTEELAGCEGINPNVFMRQLSAASPEAAAFVSDAGQHLWWACQSLQPAEGRRFIPALGMGSCGFGLPAGIGVCVGSGLPVVVIAGDGAFQFNIQELQTVARNRLPLKIVILDNRSHGSVRQLQEEVFDGRYPATVEGYDAPNFARVAEVYGIESAAVSEPDEVEAALQWLWRDPARPSLLHVLIPMELNVYPNVPFGASISTMESFHSQPVAGGLFG
jgi:acetolactate synthase I/II/III large subunit